MAQKKEDMHKEKDYQSTIKNVGIAGSQAKLVQYYGSAVKEHLVAYTGIDRETGQSLKKGLKSISKSKINPANQTQNTNQQAGFSAEVKTVARENAEKIINNGKNARKIPKSDKTRTIRTDDVAKQTTAAGTTVGGTNDQLYDLITINEDGSFIEGSARQLKYVGDNAEKCCQKLMEKKFDKYREAGAELEVPKDFYAKVQSELDRRAESLERQIENARKKGNVELMKKHEQQLERVKQTKSSLREGKLTKNEAIFARLHPKLSTAKDIANISNRAGLDAAKTGAIIGAGMSFIYNSVAVLKGDETPEDAALAVVGDTTSAAGLSYVTGFMGSAIKGGMQNAESAYLSVLSDTALPAMIATTVLETSKTLYRFADGQIDGLQCLNELGEKGSGIVASTIGATIGQALIPVPVIGGLVGSMCGYALSSMYYNTLTTALNEAKMAREERIQIEAECEAAIAAIREYRFEMELAIRDYFTDHIRAFDDAFYKMHQAFHTGNIDLLVEGANGITEALGKEALFHTAGELDALMADDNTIVI